MDSPRARDGLHATSACTKPTPIHSSPAPSKSFADTTALFTFEFAIGEYLATKGIQIGSDETLNQFTTGLSQTLV